jgi:hypothetical protein
MPIFPLDTLTRKRVSRLSDAPMRNCPVPPEPSRSALRAAGNRRVAYTGRSYRQEYPLIAGLRSVGLVDGRTAGILVHEAEARIERLLRLAGELVAGSRR